MKLFFILLPLVFVGCVGPGYVQVYERVESYGYQPNLSRSSYTIGGKTWTSYSNPYSGEYYGGYQPTGYVRTQGYRSSGSYRTSNNVYRRPVRTQGTYQHGHHSIQFGIGRGSSLHGHRHGKDCKR